MQYKFGENKGIVREIKEFSKNTSKD